MHDLKGHSRSPELPLFDRSYIIGQRYDATCACITSLDGSIISWATETRYLGIYIVSSRVFKCSLHHAKCGFYRAANAIFGKVGRISSEEVVLQLVTRTHQEMR